MHKSKIIYKAKFKNWNTKINNWRMLNKNYKIKKKEINKDVWNKLYCKEIRYKK